MSLSVCLEPTEDDLEGRGDLDRASLRMEAAAAIAAALDLGCSWEDSREMVEMGDISGKEPEETSSRTGGWPPCPSGSESSVVSTS